MSFLFVVLRLPICVVFKNSFANQFYFNFSDGVASKKKSLFLILQEIVEKRLPEAFDKVTVAKLYPHCTPNSKESLYYRGVFEKSFADLAKHFLPYYWMPRWVEGITDPSARFIKHYAAEDHK